MSSKYQIQFTDSVQPIARDAITRVIEAEGGYVNDPEDKGGETKFGISKRWYPEMNIELLTPTHAAQIYHSKYWKKNSCHLLPACIALVVFDCAVNQGGLFARKTLQRALNEEQDGVIGPKTLGAVGVSDAFDDRALVATEFTRFRCEHYTDLVKSENSQVRFIGGWINRALNTLAYAIEKDVV